MDQIGTVRDKVGETVVIQKEHKDGLETCSSSNGENGQSSSRTDTIQYLTDYLR